MSFRICLLLTWAWAFQACQETKLEPQDLIQVISGETMGSTYAISYRDSLSRDFGPAIDSILLEYNAEISTYDPKARLSLFNEQDSLTLPANAPRHLPRCWNLAQEALATTQTWFNPCIGPLSNYWGFGAKRKAVSEVDSNQVQNLLQLSKLWDSIKVTSLQDGALHFSKPQGVKLDFNAFAPGDAADVLALYLEKQGIKHYLVDVGGEMRALGESAKNYCWRVGISKPDEKAQKNDHQVIVRLCNQALATSGNYRNYHQVNGQRYAHTISPKTGYPTQSRLLSITILAPKAWQADAYATACMAMGDQAAWDWIQTLEQIEAYLILAKEQGGYEIKATQGFTQVLEQ